MRILNIDWISFKDGKVFGTYKELAEHRKKNEVEK